MDVRALSALWFAARGRVARKRPLATLALLTLLAVYLGGAALWAGTRLGGALGTLDAEATGRALWRVPLFLGVAGALWDGGCVVDPAPCRPYFIALRTLIAAEGMLGLTTPVKRVLGALGLAFALGLSWGRPALLPMGLLYAALAILWTACLERVVHVISPAGILRQRTFLVVFLGLGAGILALSSLGGRPLSIPIMSALDRLWSLPGVQLVRYWQTGAPAHLLAPLGATLALAALTAACLRAELALDRGPSSALGAGRPWVFSRPWLGIARLQIHQILASRAGQMRLLMLLISVFLAKEPELLTVGTLKSPHALAAIAAAVSFGAVLVVPLCNLLGFDRGGVRTWWRAPLADRDLLLGKVAGCAAYAAIAAPILLILIAQAQAWHLAKNEGPGGLGLHVARSAHPMGGGVLFAVALMLAALFLWWAGSGLGKSLRAPWPMPLTSYAVKVEFDEEKMARVGVFLAPLAWVGPLFAATLALGWVAAAGAMAFVLVASALRFRSRLDRACADLPELREALSATLSDSPG